MMHGFAKIASLKKLMLAATIMLATVFAAQAATYTVTNADDSGAGSLRDAINQANASTDNDTIIFASGANGTITLLSALPNLANNGTLTITGNGAGLTIISGNNAVRPLSVNGGSNVTLNALTITQGNISGAHGGGIFNNGTLTINASVVSGNSAPNGFGGGIISFGSVTINKSSVSSNFAQNAGGLVIVGNTLSVTDSTFSNNTTEFQASAINLFSGTQATLTNTTVSGNSSQNSQGGILNSGSKLDLINCTVANNISRTVFGAIWTNNATAVTTLTNTLVADNSLKNFLTSNGGTLISNGYNLDSDGTSGFVNGAGSDIVGTSATPIDANLAPLADNGGTTLTHALLDGSPAIDKGFNAGGNAADQRGSVFERTFDYPAIAPAPGGDNTDIGAFEMQPDSDGDGVPDINDNCPDTSNASQANFDGDAQGDACDADDDNDNVLDINDAFPLDPNESLDTDSDGIGNNADNDDDNDNQTDADETTCGSNPLDASSKSADNDVDNSPDCVDTDDDNDGVTDAQDAFPFDANESVDTDNDGIGNNADADDDGDGQTDVDETTCGSNSLLASSKSLDTDGDNRPNCVDTDDDNDGVLDTSDNCPLVVNPNQADFDLDGIGDTCDPQTGPPQNKEQCKNGGWMRFDFPRTFENQGDCIQFVNTGK